MDAVEDVKSRLSIEDVIGEYVQLKRAGRNFKGLSPFTSERSPSFMVSPEKQIWHDFSSGKGGNMFSFIMEVEGLDFRGALELLARKAGIDLEQYRGSRGRGNGQLKERLYEALDVAAKYYQVQFSKTQPAYEYVLGKRRFSKQTALEWRLGYSPESGSALVSFLRGKGFKDDEITKAGLSSRRRYGSGGIGDMFRGRVMVPLQDPQGRVVGFTARLLKDDKNAPKYINTPQTVLYDKSRHVYGLHLAKEAIRKSQFVVIVEGNLDVISSHQAGVRQVVATAGTALTEANLKALSRFTGDIRLCFDADRAGIAATERAIPIASKVGVSLSIITIPSGKDPDELIKQDPRIWQDIIAKPQYALDWLMERYQNLLDLTTATGKKEFSDILLPIVRQLADSVEQDHYMTRITEALNISRQALDTKLSKAPAPPPKTVKKVATPQEVDRAAADYRKTQDHLLALLLPHRALRQHATLLQPEMFVSPEARYMFRWLQAHPDVQLRGDQADITQITAAASSLSDEQVQSLQDYGKILVLQHEELYGDVEDLELDYEVTRMQTQLIEKYIKQQKQQLMAQLAELSSQAGGDASGETTRGILLRVKELDTLRNQAQGGQRG